MSPITFALLVLDDIHALDQSFAVDAGNKNIGAHSSVLVNLKPYHFGLALSVGFTFY